MKISFVVGGLPMCPVSTWGEIRKYTEGGLNGFSLEDYWRIKGLEVNTHFEDEIIATRKKLELPNNGLKYEEYLKYCNTEPKQNNIDFEVKRIQEEYVCDQYIKGQIKPILLSNVVLPAYSNMSDVGGISIQTVLNEDDLSVDDQTNTKKAVFIRITSKVSPDRVREFIKDRRELLTSLLENLPDKKKFMLSEEKIKIFTLRKQNLSYAAISLKLTDEIPKQLKTIEQIYIRTEKDINSLFHKNTTK